jgi:hypothetical protein
MILRGGCFAKFAFSIFANLFSLFAFFAFSRLFHLFHLFHAYFTYWVKTSITFIQKPFSPPPLWAVKKVWAHSHFSPKQKEPVEIHTSHSHWQLFRAVRMIWLGQHLYLHQYTYVSNLQLGRVKWERPMIRSIRKYLINKKTLVSLILTVALYFYFFDVLDPTIVAFPSIQVIMQMIWL